jgi:hypothetical protein
VRMAKVELRMRRSGKTNPPVIGSPCYAALR